MIVPLSHTVAGAGVIAMAGGATFTVTAFVLKQPAGNVYVMVAAPPSTPFTTPVAGSTVATPVLLLVQVPPVLVLVNVAGVPGHTDVGPVIGAEGDALTVTIIVVLHEDE